MIVELIGKFYDNHSLSIVNRELALELSKHVDLYILPLDTFDWEHKVDKNKIKAIKSLEKKELKGAADVQIRHAYPPIWTWPSSSKTKVIFIQPWEFCKIPSEWMYKFETFADHVITPSNWTAAVYEQAGLNPKKLSVVPNGFDPKLFTTDNVTKDPSKTTFIYVGCHQFRKGVDVLLEAWKEAFNKFLNVELIIKDSPQIYGQSALLDSVVRMQYKEGSGKITYIDDSLSEEEMANLYKSADCIVHPYRGEGFGMHIQEAMACGCTPLVTQNGSTEDFVVEEEFKIPSSQRPVDLFEIFAGKPGDSFTNMGSHAWVLEPDVNHLINKMRDIQQNKERRAFDSSNLTDWEEVAKQYAQIIKKVSHKDKTTREG